MKAREPSEVIQLRSASAVLMICDLQFAGNAWSREREPLAGDRGDPELKSGQSWRRYKNRL